MERLATTPTIDPLIGSQVGDYRIEERIGSGGMGIVYRAIQPLIDKQVAIKILRPEIADDPEQMKRLLEEARAVTAIHHRGIIDIFGFGQLLDGRQYMVMEHLVGSPLDELITAGRRLTFAETLAVLDEILSALTAAHAAGVIHRDLKPSNIFVARQGDGAQYVKLLDFGLAKKTKSNGSTPQTRLSMMVGTPEYMAPEQARGEPVAPPTDLYALGVITFQLLTGQLPFTGRTPIETVLHHLDKVPPYPSTINPEVPRDLDRLVMALLAKNPADRPRAAEQVRQQLRRISLPGVAPLPPVAVTGPLPGPVVLAAARAAETMTEPLAPTVQRRRPLTVVLPLVSCVVALGLFWVGRSELHRLKPAPPPVAAPAKITVVVPAPPPPAPAKAEVPPPAPVMTKPAKALVRSEPPAPTRESLARRIARDEGVLKRKTPPGETPDPLVAVVLQAAKHDLTRADEAEARRVIARKLDALEMTLLGKH